MKKLLAALTLALLVSLALAVSAANATHSNGNGPKQDLVSGTGQFQGPFAIDLEIHVNAKSGPSGEDAQGHFFVRRAGFSELDFRGEVTCLNIQGNQAMYGGEITKSKADPTLEGLGVMHFVEDNGEGNEPNDRSDGFFTATPPEECPFSFLPHRFLPPTFEQGNYIVHDATP